MRRYPSHGGRPRGALLPAAQGGAIATPRPLPRPAAAAAESAGGLLTSPLRFLFRDARIAKVVVPT
jgi:hypothetical protein